MVYTVTNIQRGSGGDRRSVGCFVCVCDVLRGWRPNRSNQGGRLYAYSHESRDVNNTRRALYIYTFLFVYTRYNIIMVSSNYLHTARTNMNNIKHLFLFIFTFPRFVQSLNC